MEYESFVNAVTALIQSFIITLIIFIFMYYLQVGGPQYVEYKRYKTHKPDRK